MRLDTQLDFQQYRELVKLFFNKQQAYKQSGLGGSKD